MSSVTLVLTRLPAREFIYVKKGKDYDQSADKGFEKGQGYYDREVDGLSDDERSRLYRSKPGLKNADITHYSGRWGAMAMIEGPEVYSVQFVDGELATRPEIQKALKLGAAVDTSLLPPFPNAPPASRPKPIAKLSFNDRVLALLAESEKIDNLSEFTTMERYRDQYGRLQPDGRPGYVCLYKRPRPYNMQYETGNKVIKEVLDPHGSRALPGECLHTRNLSTDNPKLPDQFLAILIHEAPNATCLTGCISPRPKGAHGAYRNENGNPSHIATQKVTTAARKAPNATALLFVMDD